MKKKEIKGLLSRFDETKLPDKHKMLEGCGAEYRYQYKEKKAKFRRGNFLPALLVFIIMSTITVFATAAANIEDMQEFFNYVEYRIRYFYGDGSYSDEIIGTYVPNDVPQSSQQTLRPPDGMAINPEYWENHQKDVSGYTAEVTHVQPKVNRIVIHVNGGEDFKIYESYVKLERKIKADPNGKWRTVYERLLPVYNASGTVPTTIVYKGFGDFSVNINNLQKYINESETGFYTYRVSVMVCTPTGEMDAGEISAEFDAEDFMGDELAGEELG